MEVLTHKETQGCKHTNAAMLQFSLAVEEQSPLRDARGDFEWIKEAHWRSLPNTLQHVICTGQYFGVTCTGDDFLRYGCHCGPVLTVHTLHDSLDVVRICGHVPATAIRVLDSSQCQLLPWAWTRKLTGHGYHW